FDGYSRIFGLGGGDKLDWEAVADMGNNPDQRRTEYVIAYFSLGAGKSLLAAMQAGRVGNEQSHGTGRDAPYTPRRVDGAASSDASFEPVCGCARPIHPSEAAASAAGVVLAVNGGCGVLRDFIACGAHYCDPRLSYCEIVLSDVADPPTDYTCKPLPPACRP